ncbi:D-alanyl-D-alanine carboxypeptidase [Siminovitchia terrae]|uniref:M15 family metallopeptidase n=1 Tax=Siminovitchia terrae TaxID=1914933 RepID=UPI001B205ED6|nr:M15 family metallopeptidase [Siminovitchia terrae]GIN91906.1 D-alanyl-D-alanine carboxypeptidase [Siminovitchia terrae]
MKKIANITMIVLLLGGCQWNQFFDESKEQQKPDDISEKNQTEENQRTNDVNKKADPELALEAAYFNEIIEVDGRKEIVNASNILALVNKTYALPSDYAPEDLIRPKVAFSFGDQDIEKSYLRKEAARALEKMFEAAKKDGIQLYASSGYRSYDRQKEVFQVETARSGEKKATEAVAIPGSSEHQTGLAMDITSESVQYFLVEELEHKPEGKWLRENAHHYGFILRYLKGKEDITGYQYEPWHFRYVGVKAAKIIYERNWTLEEYFEHVSKI